MLKTDIVILAAGKGTRLHSEEKQIPKCMFPIGGKPMLEYIVTEAEKTNIKPIVVIGFLGEQIQDYFGDRVLYAQQEDPQNPSGTGKAVQAATPFFQPDTERVIIIPGDHSYNYKLTDLEKLLESHQTGINGVPNDITVLTFEIDDPFSYGRVIADNSGKVQYIVEEKNATEEEKQVKIISSALFVVERDVLEELLPKITPNSVNGEYYFTDIVELANQNGFQVGACQFDRSFFDGVNTQEQLDRAQETLER